MPIHGHVSYSAGAGAHTWTPAGDASIKPYDGFAEGEIVGMSVNTDGVTAGEYVRLAISQLPAYAENEVFASCDNTNAAAVVQHIDALQTVRGIILPKSMDMVVTTVTGGNIGSVVHVRYGPVIPAVPGARTIRRYDANAALGSLAWTAGTALTDLDPTKLYGLRGLSLWSNSNHQNIAGRFITARSACRPAGITGGFVDWVASMGEYAVIFQGDEDPYMEYFSIDGGGAGAISASIILEELPGTGQGSGAGGGFFGGLSGIIGGGNRTGGLPTSVGSTFFR